MTGYSGMFHDYGLGFYNHTFDLEGVESLTYVRGRHTFKVGVDAATYKSYQPNPAAPLGTFAFSGQWTGNKGQPSQPSSQGNAYADFLLGVVNTTTSGNANALGAVYYSWDWNFYVQDTWQVTSRLTFYYGLRYFYQTPWDWQGDYSTYWDPKTNRLALPQDSADSHACPRSAHRRRSSTAITSPPPRRSGYPSTTWSPTRTIGVRGSAWRTGLSAAAARSSARATASTTTSCRPSRARATTC